MFINLSEEFKKAREEKKYTVNQLSAKTKIDIRFIEAMEAGDFAFLPELYVKAFVKEYARAVGLDESIIIKKYEAAKQGLVYDEATPVVEEKKPEPQKVKEEKKVVTHTPPSITNPVQSYDATALSNIQDDSADKNRKKNILIGSVTGGIIILFLLYLIFFTSDSEIIVPEKPFEEVVKESGQRYEEETLPDDAPVASSDSLYLTINASDTSWVKIIFDDKREDEFILFPNSKKSIKTLNNFKITFGKSGAISLELNDQSLNYKGRGNSVLHVKIDSSGISYLDSAPSVSQ